MATRIAYILQRGLNTLGFKRPSLESELNSLLATQDMVNLLQVGANDGRTGDPLYKFLSSHPNRTRIILVEPQPDLIPTLTRNYDFHPAKAIVQAAAGPMGRLVLHRVHPEAWADLDLRYGKDWPEYRAPTGITSMQRDLVRGWVMRHYRGQKSIDAVIDTFEVPALPTPTIISNAGLFKRLDVLQIDAEGFDDTVIRSSDIAGLKPAVIHFEARHLGRSRYWAVKRELRQLGYRVHRLGRDALAVRRNGL